MCRSRATHLGAPAEDSRLKMTPRTPAFDGARIVSSAEIFVDGEILAVYAGLCDARHSGTDQNEEQLGLRVEG
jgi:hypothetical protein